MIYRVETPIHNEIVHADVRISKTDLTGSESLPGALIEVRNAEGEMVCRGYTGEDGTLPTFPAVPGRYTFREVWAPEGYALSEAEMAFTVHENGEVTGQTALADEVTRFSIQRWMRTGNRWRVLNLAFSAKTARSRLPRYPMRTDWRHLRASPMGHTPSPKPRRCPVISKPDTGPDHAGRLLCEPGKAYCHL